MKKQQLFILICIIIIQLNLHGQPTDYVGYWKLDGNAHDETGNYSGTINGAAGTFGKDNNANGALLFDGVDDYIITDLNLSGYTAVTFSTWIKASSISGSHKIISQESNTAGIERDIYLRVCQVNGANRIYFYIKNGSNYKYIYTGDVIDLNTWYHIVGTWFSATGEMKIFLNSIEQSVTETVSGVLSVISNTSNSNIKFGCEYVGSAYFNGSIDEIMIFDRTLESCEIESLFSNSNLCNTTSGLWLQNTENIYYEGNVAIGRINVPSGFNFALDGKMITKEVKVTLDGWSDFVLKPEYSLMPIQEVENYILLNNHLPSIPTEKEVKENGINIGDMNAKLLQKIEELTLYMIEQNKKNEEQSKEIEILKQKIRELEK